MKFSAELLWSFLTIDIKDAGDFFVSDVERCFEMTRKFEKKYSRFISWNYLSELNHSSKAKIDDEFYSMINLALKVSEMTQWYFDITLLPLLENAWYWISKIKLKENIWYKNIVLLEDKIELKNWVQIDLWSVGKGYMIDKIFKYLDKKYNDFIIDFGWDIKVKWKHKVSLEDPNDTSKNIWNINLNNLSIASSSGNRRQFWDIHHLIDPKWWKSIQDKQTIFLTHKFASFSDIFSTALFVSPIDIAIKVLNTVPGLEGIVIMTDGTIHKTKNFAWQI